MVRALLLMILTLLPGMALAESWQTYRERRPELFDAETGFRIARYRAPLPDDIPGPIRIAAPLDAARWLSRGAIAIDVYGTRLQRFDDLDGTWLGEGARMTLPGATWLPEVGRGNPEPRIETYLAAKLRALTGGDLSRPLLIFCRADCWMSWNAARRAAALGYSSVIWYPLGIEGWEEIGGALAPAFPVPLALD